MYIKILTLSLFNVLLFSSCAADDEKSDINEGRSENLSIEIVDFKIVSNSASGLVLETEFSGIQNADESFFEYGVVWEHNKTKCFQINNKKIAKKNIQFIDSGLSKGIEYSVYPYFFDATRKSNVFGNKISFISNVDSNFKILSVFPKNGFVNDTLNIRGVGFCSKKNVDFNSLLLNETRHEVFYESDTLLKAKINSSINNSKLDIAVSSCNIIKSTTDYFKINEPVFDSISSSKVYVGETFFLYGKNIHSNLNKVEIAGIPANIIKANSIDKLEVEVPENLPSGLLDVDLKLFDKIAVRKEQIFKSTTPVIESISDTISYNSIFKINGVFFNQRPNTKTVLIGGVEQPIIKISDNEIEVRLSNVIYRKNPKLELIIGNHKLTESVNISPPEIIGFAKDYYNIDDKLRIKVKGYIKGSEEQIKISNRKVSYFEYDRLKEEIVVSLSPHFQLQFTGSLLQIEESGGIAVEVTSVFGSSRKIFELFPPKIDEIDKTEYSIGEELIVKGNNFGNFDLSAVSINNELIDVSNRINAAKSNYESKIKIPENLNSGTHTIAITLGGKKSNIFNFYVKPSQATNLNPKRGTRKTLFKVTGDNLEIGGYITVDDKAVKIIERNNTEIFFKLIEGKGYNSFSSVKYHYGTEVSEIGIMEVVEPFSFLDNYNLSSSYSSLHSSTFIYNKTLYFVNRNGFFKFNVTRRDFTKVDIPLIDELSFNRKFYTVKNDKLYVPAGQKAKVFNFLTSKWGELDIDFNDDTISIFRITSLGDYLFLAVIEDSTDRFPKASMYKYHIETKELIEIDLPYSKARHKVFNSFENEGKLIYKSRTSNFFSYDINEEFWEDIGNPGSPSIKNSWDYSVYVHNNILYVSGGLDPNGSAQPWSQFNSYDFNTNKWVKNTSMPRKKARHSTIEYNDKLYILLGASPYTTHENRDLMVYDIEKDF